MVSDLIKQQKTGAGFNLAPVFRIYLSYQRL